MGNVGKQESHYIYPRDHIAIILSRTHTYLHLILSWKHLT